MTVTNPRRQDEITESLLQKLHEAIVVEKKNRTTAPTLPSVLVVTKIIDLLKRVIFATSFEDDEVSCDRLRFQLGMTISELLMLIQEQVTRALICDTKDNSPQGAEQCRAMAQSIAAQFMQQIPMLRMRLLLDVDACMQADPAATSPEEIILCYPGIQAIFVHRVAHELWKLKVPLLPRMMSEQCHGQTGIDIHPGATIGDRFFIDHGTGVVIGEMSVVGNNVKVFHGVTLGALSTADGQALAGKKRHPTIEDDVTIYAGATILGGKTVVGKGAVIGGSAFVTRSVPAFHVVSQAQPVQPPRPLGNKPKTYQSFDWAI